MSIGERIKHIRKEQGLSIDDVAEKLGKNRTTVYRYENGDIENLPLGILDSLASTLNTTPAYLMGWNTTEIEYKNDNDNIHETIMKYTGKWIDEFGTGIFDQEEVEKIIQYARFLITLRDK